ncbi:LysM domain-containing protein [Curtobacterium sp. 9128]|uniref:LysM peptidoglycan-binding domain-containing protein n=1 Tax=Curtobacterium sp. 9128 TaxID=1793722 RepID=UPI0011A4B993|nr:LysM domain-containing protein [Curtobacterium sp. 9128]
MNRRPLTVAVAGAAVVVALTGCTALVGHEPLPTPTRTTAATPGPHGSTTGKSVSSVSLDPPALAAGTVVTETDLTSPSGKTSVHVQVVANSRGTFDVHLSGYRTTNPQAMTIQFSEDVPKPGDGPDQRTWGATQWSAASGPPATAKLSDAGTRPDFLRSVSLVPTLIDDGDGSTPAPWAGHVLAVAPLTWSVPNPYPNLAVTVGAAGPGAYGVVQDADGRPSTYLVAHGDDLTTVAKRFGISVAQLRWLNPAMETRNGDWILENTTLNLNPAAR